MTNRMSGPGRPRFGATRHTPRAAAPDAVFSPLTSSPAAWCDIAGLAWRAVSAEADRRGGRTGSFLGGDLFHWRSTVQSHDDDPRRPRRTARYGPSTG